MRFYYFGYILYIVLEISNGQTILRGNARPPSNTQQVPGFRNGRTNMNGNNLNMINQNNLLRSPRRKAMLGNIQPNHQRYLGPAGNHNLQNLPSRQNMVNPLRSMSNHQSKSPQNLNQLKPLSQNHEQQHPSPGMLNQLPPSPNKVNPLGQINNQLNQSPQMVNRIRQQPQLNNKLRQLPQIPNIHHLSLDGNNNEQNDKNSPVSQTRFQGRPARMNRLRSLSSPNQQTRRTNHHRINSQQNHNQEVRGLHGRLKLPSPTHSHMMNQLRPLLSTKHNQDSQNMDRSPTDHRPRMMNVLGKNTADNVLPNKHLNQRMNQINSQKPYVKTRNQSNQLETSISNRFNSLSHKNNHYDPDQLPQHMGHSNRDIMLPSEQDKNQFASDSLPHNLADSSSNSQFLINEEAGRDNLLYSHHFTQENSTKLELHSQSIEHHNILPSRNISKGEHVAEGSPIHENHHPLVINDNPFHGENYFNGQNGKQEQPGSARRNLNQLPRLRSLPGGQSQNIGRRRQMRMRLRTRPNHRTPQTQPNGRRRIRQRLLNLPRPTIESPKLTHDHIFDDFYNPEPTINGIKPRDSNNFLASNQLPQNHDPESNYIMSHRFGNNHRFLPQQISMDKKRTRGSSSLRKLGPVNRLTIPGVEPLLMEPMVSGEEYTSKITLPYMHPGSHDLAIRDNSTENLAGVVDPPKDKTFKDFPKTLSQTSAAILDYGTEQYWSEANRSSLKDKIQKKKKTSLLKMRSKELKSKSKLTNKDKNKKLSVKEEPHSKPNKIDNDVPTTPESIPWVWPDFPALETDQNHHMFFQEPESIKTTAAPYISTPNLQTTTVQLTTIRPTSIPQTTIRPTKIRPTTKRPTTKIPKGPMYKVSDFHIFKDTKKQKEPKTNHFMDFLLDNPFGRLHSLTNNFDMYKQLANNNGFGLTNDVKYKDKLLTPPAFKPPLIRKKKPVTHKPKFYSEKIPLRGESVGMAIRTIDVRPFLRTTTALSLHQQSDSLKDTKEDTQTKKEPTSMSQTILLKEPPPFKPPKTSKSIENSLFPHRHYTTIENQNQRLYSESITPKGIVPKNEKGNGHSLAPNIGKIGQINTSALTEHVNNSNHTIASESFSTTLPTKISTRIKPTYVINKTEIIKDLQKELLADGRYVDALVENYIFRHLISEEEKTLLPPDFLSTSDSSSSTAEQKSTTSSIQKQKNESASQTQQTYNETVSQLSSTTVQPKESTTPSHDLTSLLTTTAPKTYYTTSTTTETPHLPQDQNKTSSSVLKNVNLTTISEVLETLNKNILNLQQQQSSSPVLSTKPTITVTEELKTIVEYTSTPTSTTAMTTSQDTTSTVTPKSIIATRSTSRIETNTTPAYSLNTTSTTKPSPSTTSKTNNEDLFTKLKSFITNLFTSMNEKHTPKVTPPIESTPHSNSVTDQPFSTTRGHETSAIKHDITQTIKPSTINYKANDPSSTTPEYKPLVRKYETTKRIEPINKKFSTNNLHTTTGQGTYKLENQFETTPLYTSPIISSTSSPQSTSLQAAQNVSNPIRYPLGLGVLSSNQKTSTSTSRFDFFKTYLGNAGQIPSIFPPKLIQPLWNQWFNHGVSSQKNIEALQNELIKFKHGMPNKISMYNFWSDLTTSSPEASSTSLGVSSTLPSHSLKQGISDRNQNKLSPTQIPDNGITVQPKIIQSTYIQTVNSGTSRPLTTTKPTISKLDESALQLTSPEPADHTTTGIIENVPISLETIHRDAIIHSNSSTRTIMNPVNVSTKSVNSFKRTHKPVTVTSTTAPKPIAPIKVLQDPIIRDSYIPIINAQVTDEMTTSKSVVPQTTIISDIEPRPDVNKTNRTAPQLPVNSLITKLGSIEYSPLSQEVSSSSISPLTKQGLKNFINNNVTTARSVDHTSQRPAFKIINAPKRKSGDVVSTPKSIEKVSNFHGPIISDVTTPKSVEPTVVPFIPYMISTERDLIHRDPLKTDLTTPKSGPYSPSDLVTETPKPMETTYVPEVLVTNDLMSLDSNEQLLVTETPLVMTTSQIVNAPLIPSLNVSILTPSTEVIRPNISHSTHYKSSIPSQIPQNRSQTSVISPLIVAPKTSTTATTTTSGDLTTVSVLDDATIPVIDTADANATPGTQIDEQHNQGPIHDRPQEAVTIHDTSLSVNSLSSSAAINSDFPKNQLDQTAPETVDYNHEMAAPQLPDLISTDTVDPPKMIEATTISAIPEIHPVKDSTLYSSYISLTPPTTFLNLDFNANINEPSNTIIEKTQTYRPSTSSIPLITSTAQTISTLPSAQSRYNNQLDFQENSIFIQPIDQTHIQTGFDQPMNQIHPQTNPSLDQPMNQTHSQTDHSLNPQTNQTHPQTSPSSNPPMNQTRSQTTPNLNPPINQTQLQENLMFDPPVNQSHPREIPNFIKPIDQLQLQEIPSFIKWIDQLQPQEVPAFMKRIDQEQKQENPTSIEPIDPIHSRETPTFINKVDNKHPESNSRLNIPMENMHPPENPTFIHPTYPKHPPENQTFIHPTDYMHPPENSTFIHPIDLIHPQENPTFIQPIDPMHPSENPTFIQPTDLMHQPEYPTFNQPTDPMYPPENPTFIHPTDPMNPPENHTFIHPVDPTHPQENSNFIHPIDHIHLQENPTFIKPTDPMNPAENPIFIHPIDLIHPQENPTFIKPTEPMHPRENPIFIHPIDLTHPQENLTFIQPTDPMHPKENPTFIHPIDPIHQQSNPTFIQPTDPMRPQENPTFIQPTDPMHPQANPTFIHPYDPVHPQENPGFILPNHPMHPQENPTFIQPTDQTGKTGSNNKHNFFMESQNRPETIDASRDPAGGISLFAFDKHWISGNLNLNTLHTAQNNLDSTTPYPTIFTMNPFDRPSNRNPFLAPSENINPFNAISASYGHNFGQNADTFFASPFTTMPPLQINPFIRKPPSLNSDHFPPPHHNHLHGNNFQHIHHGFNDNHFNGHDTRPIYPTQQAPVDNPFLIKNSMVNPMFAFLPIQTPKPFIPPQDNIITKDSFLKKMSEKKNVTQSTSNGMTDNILQKVLMKTLMELEKKRADPLNHVPMKGNIPGFVPPISTTTISPTTTPYNSGEEVETPPVETTEITTTENIYQEIEPGDIVPTFPPNSTAPPGAEWEEYYYYY